MAQKMEVNAPKWWRLLGTLLDDKGTADLTGRKDGGGDESVDDAQEIEGDDNEYGELGMRPAMTDKRAKCRAAIKLMVRVLYTVSS